MTTTAPRTAPPADRSLLVLVTGVTGQQGGHVARALLARGHRVRGLVRDPDHADLTAFRGNSFEAVPGSFEDAAALEAAARGVDALFLMGTPFGVGEARETENGLRALAASKRAGVPWLVYSSVASADRRTGLAHFDSKFAVEEQLRRSGLPYAISAPVAFMENLLQPFQLPALREGKLAMGLSPNRPQQMVALDDLGRFVTLLLENPARFRGQRIDVASDEVDGLTVARVLSEASRRTIEYRQIPQEFLRSQNAGFAKMFEWMETVGYSVDIGGLRQRYPEVGWHRFSEWAARQDWARLLA